MAKPTGKKRTVSVDDDTLPRSKRAKTSPKGSGSNQSSSPSGGSTSSGSSNKKRRSLNGLINHQNSCFSAVVLQLLDAALEDQDLDSLLDELDDSLETFGLDVQKCKLFDKTIHIGDLEPKLVEKQKAVRKAVRKAIKASAKAGETEKISAAKHLRKLLGDLQTEYQGEAAKKVSPYIFQSVFAFGGAEDAALASNDLSDRQQMSGDAQEDSFDYYQRVLNTVAEDPHVADANALKSLFEVETETRDVCMRLGCGYKSEPRKATSNYHDISVPEKKRGEHCSLESLLADSKMSRRQDKCPKRAKSVLTAKIDFTKVGENFVVKLNRASYDKKTFEAVKIDTLIDMDTPIYEILDDKYQLSAVINHSGLSADFGHYSIFRKLGDSWYLLNDGDCSKKTAARVKDSPRDGQSAMLLFKKVKA